MRKLTKFAGVVSVTAVVALLGLVLVTTSAGAITKHSTAITTLKLNVQPDDGVTVTFPVTSNADTPAGMNTRIPPGVNTPVNVTVAGLTGANTVTLSVTRIAGTQGAAAVNGAATMTLGNGTSTVQLQGTQQTECRANSPIGPNLELVATPTGGGAPIAQSNAFAVSAIPIDYLETLVGPISTGADLGLEVADSWTSDAATSALYTGPVGMAALDCTDVGEVVIPAGGKTSGYLKGDKKTHDKHTTPRANIVPGYMTTTDQFSAFKDFRSNSLNICMPSSGYTITRTANGDPVTTFTTTKSGTAFSSVSGKVIKNHVVESPNITCTTLGNGATSPAGGDTETQDVGRR